MKALRAEGTVEHSGRWAFQFREDVGTIKDVMCRVRGAAPAIPVHADAGFVTTSVPVAPWMRMFFRYVDVDRLPEWQFLPVISFKPRLLVLPARFDEDESDRHSMPMMLPLVVARRTNGDCNEQQQ